MIVVTLGGALLFVFAVVLVAMFSPVGGISTRAIRVGLAARLLLLGWMLVVIGVVIVLLIVVEGGEGIRHVIDVR